MIDFDDTTMVIKKQDGAPSSPADLSPARAGGLRTGFTTGACASAACRAALLLLWTGQRQDSVSIRLPSGQMVSFAIEKSEYGKNWANSCVRKDAGDDPDVTHNALIYTKVRAASRGSGVRFSGGIGVGIVRLAGLPLPVGEPAINPVPRQMITDIIKDLSCRLNRSCDIDVEISIPNGAVLAKKTWNPRLGIKGGLSILGTTGIVRPYSCSAWIHAIHRGIDVARANGLHHLAGATGNNSEKTVQKYYNMKTIALIDMGDFVGGMMKYLLRHPIAHITVAGGVGKITKLSQGFMDLHSKRSQTDMSKLAIEAEKLGADEKISQKIKDAPMVAAAIELLQIELREKLYQRIAQQAFIRLKHLIMSKKLSMRCSVLISGRNKEVFALAGDELHEEK